MNEKKKKALAAVVRVGLIVILQAACGAGAGGPAAPSPGSPSPGPTPQASPPLGSIDPALVGRWTGTVCCIFGPAQMSMDLNADATTQFRGTGRYCQVDGSWGVSGMEFVARGGDCTGTVVTLSAPASSTQLEGRVTTSGGAFGTFSVTKQ